MRAEQAERAVFCRGLAVVERVLLRQGVAHAHHNAALDLPFAGQRVDGLANIVRGDHLFNFARLLVENAHLRRVAIGDMADGVRHICAERVRLGVVFAVKLLPLQIAQRAVLHRVAQQQAGAAAGLAGDERLARAGGIAAVRRYERAVAVVDDLIARELCVCHDELHQHRAETLTDAGRARADVDLAILADDELAAPIVGKTDADARVFHRAGKADGLAVFHGFVIVGLDGLERFDKARFRADDLAVRQHLARADGVAVANLPRGDADKVGHLV